MVLVQSIKINNLGPIAQDEVTLEPFTFFVGRNNAGKTHYLNAIDILLNGKTKQEIPLLQRDRSVDVVVEAAMVGVEAYTDLVDVSNHRESIEGAIRDGVLRVRRTLSPSEGSKLSIVMEDGSLHNPGGFDNNLKKVLPEVISIPAITDTLEELKSTQTTALSKLKKEVLTQFMQDLSERARESLAPLNIYLHGEAERSEELAILEERLRAEITGEFADVVPQIKFELPDQEVIAKEMQIILDDGYPSDVAQKGHGLQRATLLALLRVLAKHGARYQGKPEPIFLLGEVESFLHPFAQEQFAKTLVELSSQYQILATTHSPFIINPNSIAGYRRVIKGSGGTSATGPGIQPADKDKLVRHLSHRGNLIGLFADRVILIEGLHDVGFFERLVSVLGLAPRSGEFVPAIESGGKDCARTARSFYISLGFSDTALLLDLDYLFCTDAEHLCNELGISTKNWEKLRAFIDKGGQQGDVKLEVILEKIETEGEPEGLDEFISDLEPHGVYVFRRGAPEYYYVSRNGEKAGWMSIETEEDLTEAEHLRELFSKVLGLID